VSRLGSSRCRPRRRKCGPGWSTLRGLRDRLERFEESAGEVLGSSVDRRFPEQLVCLRGARRALRVSIPCGHLVRNRWRHQKSDRRPDGIERPSDTRCGRVDRHGQSGGRHAHLVQRHRARAGRDRDGVHTLCVVPPNLRTDSAEGVPPAPCLPVAGVVAFTLYISFQVWLFDEARPAGGRGLVFLLTFVTGALFWWWSSYMLLYRQVPLRRMFPAGAATGACVTGLGVFSSLFFSHQVTSGQRATALPVSSSR
jgi:hypothetical protein